jgi:hypothetical protein
MRSRLEVLFQHASFWLLVGLYCAACIVCWVMRYDLLEEGEVDA